MSNDQNGVFPNERHFSILAKLVRGSQPSFCVTGSNGARINDEYLIARSSRLRCLFLVHFFFGDFPSHKFFSKVNFWTVTCTCPLFISKYLYLVLYTPIEGVTVFTMLLVTCRVSHYHGPLCRVSQALSRAASRIAPLQTSPRNH